MMLMLPPLVAGPIVRPITVAVKAVLALMATLAVFVHALASLTVRT